MLAPVYLASAQPAAPPAAVPRPFDATLKRELLDQLQDLLSTKAYVGGVHFGEWKDHEATYFDALDAAASPEAFAVVVNGALAEFGISHAALIPPSLAKQSRGSSIGIGVMVHMTNDGGLRVLRVLPDSPAAGADIAPGDVIIQIDGHKPNAPEELEGEPNSSVSLRLRKLSGQRVDLSLTRRLVVSRTPATLTILDQTGQPIEGPIVDPDTSARYFGLLRLPTFAQGYSEYEVRRLFRACKVLDGLIIDLRGNGGGLVGNLQHFLSFMVIEGEPVGVGVSSYVAAQYVEATGGDPADVVKVAAWSKNILRVPENPIRPFPGPIVVLLDRASASASELSAQALRELRHAKICGRTSAGALLVSHMLPLPGGFVAQIPVSDYVSAAGIRPEGQGVAPDITPARRSTRKGLDPDVDAALTSLLEDTSLIEDTDPSRQVP